VRRDLERRLARAEVAANAIYRNDLEAVRRRQALRNCAKTHELIRERLRLMGIDPAHAVALRRGEEAAAELDEIPDTPELQAADEALLSPDYDNRDDGVRNVEEIIAPMAQRCRRDQYRLDLANASPVELLALCVAIETEAWD
jgi:hypothetical protein